MGSGGGSAGPLICIRVDGPCPAASVSFASPTAGSTVTPNDMGAAPVVDDVAVATAPTDVRGRTEASVASCSGG